MAWDDCPSASSPICSLQCLQMLVLEIGTLHSGHRTLATVRLSVGDDIAVVGHCIAQCTADGATTRFTGALTTVLRQGLQNINTPRVSCFHITK